MDEIEVFSSEDSDVPPDKSQKELFYENLKTSGKFPAYCYDDFLRLDNESANEVPSDTNIPEILLGWVVEYCLPIIGNPKNFNIALQCPHPISAFNGKIVTIASNTTINVVGMIIAPIRFYKPLNMRIDNYRDLMSYCHLLQIGSPVNLLPLLKLVGKLKRNKILFTSKEQAVTELKFIIKYVQLARHINDIHVYYRFDDAKKCKQKLVPFDALPSAKPIKSLIFSDFDKQKLKALEDIQKYANNGLFMDVLINLYNNSTIQFYNLMLIKGTQDKQARSLIEQRKLLMEQQKMIRNNVVDMQKYINELASKRAIAMKKFKIGDLTDLTEKQAKVVDIEYKRQIIGDNFNGKLLQLFDKLEFANKYELKPLLRNIVDFSSKTRANIDAKQIIEECGICSHRYYKKLYMLNYGYEPNSVDKFLTDFGIEIDEICFCSICGEDLGEKNATQQLAFQGEIQNVNYEDIDPVQKMIWQETMNIISTAVKFSEPVLIKPLVKSLSNGLRGVVYAEQSRLFKNKTATDSVVNDSLNVFCATYIYAALAAIMIHNPGKLIFARDKVHVDASTTSANNAKQPKQVNDAEKPPVNDAKQPKQVNDAEKPKQVNDAEKPPVNDAEKPEPVNNAEKPPVNEAEKPEPVNNAEKPEPVNNKEKPVNSTKQAKNKTGKKIKGGYIYVEGGKIVATKDSTLATPIIIKNALMLLIVSKEVAFKRLNLNIDMIKTLFSNAYTWAFNHTKPINVDKPVDDGIIANSPVTTPFYEYINKVNIIEFAAGLRKKFPEFNNTIENIGKDIKDMKTSPWDKFTRVKTNVFSFSQEIRDRKDFVFDVYNSICDYYIDIAKMTIVPPAQPVIDHNKTLDKLRLRETLIRNEIALIYAKSWFTVKVNNLPKYKPDIADFYCPDGKKHQFNLIIYRTGKKEVKYLTKDIVNMIKSQSSLLKQLYNGELSDKECVLCGNRMSNIKYNDKTLKNIDIVHAENDMIKSFYEYFDSRCPKGNIHSFVNNACENCGFTTVMSNERNKTYFNKYKTVFLKELDDIRKSATKPTRQRIIDTPPKAKKYEYSHKYINELSKIFNIDHNIIANIGFTEKILYSQIVEMQTNPSKTATSFVAPSLRIRNFILFAIREYNEFRNYDKIANIQHSHKLIINEFTKNTTAANNPIKKLPDLPEFVLLDKAYELTLPPETYLNFLQEFLAKMLIDVIVTSAEAQKPLAKKVMSMIFHKILNSNKLFAKAPPMELAEIAEHDAPDNVSETSETSETLETSDGSDDDAASDIDTFDNNQFDMDQQEIDDDSGTFDFMENQE